MAKGRQGARKSSDKHDKPARQGCLVVGLAYLVCAAITVTLGVVALSLAGVQSFGWISAVVVGCLIVAVPPWIKAVDWLVVRDIERGCREMGLKLVRVEPAPGHYLVTWVEDGQERTGKWHELLKGRR